MLTMTCDSCSAGIGKDAEHFGVDHIESTVLDEVEDDETGAVFAVATLMEIGTSHEFHFCSTSCLTSRAMGLALDDRDPS